MIRVLLAEDSAVTRAYLTYLLADDPGIEVVGAAKDGQEAVELAAQPAARRDPDGRPHAGPGRLRGDAADHGAHADADRDGDGELQPVRDPRRLHRARGRRADPARQAARAVGGGPRRRRERAAAHAQADGRGQGRPPPRGQRRRAAPVRALHRARATRAWWRSAPRPAARRRSPRSSTACPAPLGIPVLLVQHITDGFIDGFVEWLGTRTAMDVVIATHGVQLRPGTIYVAGSGRHMTRHPRRARQPRHGPPVNGFRPSISRLFDSVADDLRARVGRGAADRHGPRRRRRPAPDARRRRAHDRPGRGHERGLRDARRGGAAEGGLRGAAAAAIAEALRVVEAERGEMRPAGPGRRGQPDAGAAAAVPARAGGLRTRSAPDGVAALELAREQAPDLVLTDVVMPRMDGYTLCRSIKGDPELHDTPVILLTSLTSPQDVIEGLACGADNFVRKPYESASLLARVERCLADGAERSRVPVGRRGRRRARAGARVPVLDVRGDRPPRRRADALVSLARPALPPRRGPEPLHDRARGRARGARPRARAARRARRVDRDRGRPAGGQRGHVRAHAVAGRRADVGLHDPAAHRPRHPRPRPARRPRRAPARRRRAAHARRLRRPGRRGAGPRAAAGAPRTARAGAHGRALGRDRGAPAGGGGAARDGGDRRVRRRQHGPARPRRADRDLEPRRGAPVRLRRRRGGRSSIELVARPTSSTSCARCSAGSPGASRSRATRWCA